MKGAVSRSLFGALLLPFAADAAPPQARDVDTRFPYTGPKTPVGDWVDQSVKGNGKGFPRLVEPPAVKPASSKPKNNINVISISYIPNGVNIHFQTPFSIGQSPTIKYGKSRQSLNQNATGSTSTYDRTPPCSEIAVTQCSQFFHDVQISGLKADTTYYYQIPAAGGASESKILTFKTGRAAGDDASFSFAVLNDMGYTNAMGTHKQLINAVNDGLAFAWHGGDLSYADDWYSGILPCEDSWPVCYNGSSTRLPGPAPVPPFYKDTPLPAGEVANQGGPNGGDMNVIYESNWDLWQQWMNNITTKIPYMTLPGNHEASCAEFDGGKNTLTAYLNDDKANSSAPKSELTYYSCPPSQRNFTTFQHRFRMPGAESGGVSNFWYSFDYGLVHFVSIDTETDFPYSPEWPFVRDTDDHGLPTENQTYSTDSGPFGYINGSWKDNEAYEQWHWLKSDLTGVDRTKTPWVIVMGHRPMYSSQVSSYQRDVRDAFEDLMLEGGVDAYLAGHIHWYERTLPLGKNGTIDSSSVVNNSTYRTNPGKSITHLINGMAGNIESHSTLESGQSQLSLTAALDYVHYGFNKVTVDHATSMTFEFVKGDGSGVGDKVTLTKTNSTSSASGKRDDVSLGYE